MQISIQDQERVRTRYVKMTFDDIKFTGYMSQSLPLINL